MSVYLSFVKHLLGTRPHTECLSPSWWNFQVRNWDPAIPTTREDRARTEASLTPKLSLLPSGHSTFGREYVQLQISLSLWLSDVVYSELFCWPYSLGLNSSTPARTWCRTFLSGRIFSQQVQGWWKLHNLMGEFRRQEFKKQKQEQNHSLFKWFLVCSSWSFTKCQASLQGCHTHYPP